MKSLKSRLRRQDVPGPASSGAAAASAVSPAVRAARRSAPGAAQPSFAGEFARRLPLLFLCQFGFGGPGDSSLRPETPSAQRPRGSSPPPHPSLYGSLPHPFLPSLRTSGRNLSGAVLAPSS